MCIVYSFSVTVEGHHGKTGKTGQRLVRLVVNGKTFHWCMSRIRVLFPADRFIRHLFRIRSGSWILLYWNAFSSVLTISPPQVYICISISHVCTSLLLSSSRSAISFFYLLFLSLPISLLLFSLHNHSPYKWGETDFWKVLQLSKWSGKRSLNW